MLSHVIRVLVTWLIYRPTYYAHWIFGKALDILHTKNNFADDIKLKAEYLQRDYSSESDELSKLNNDQLDDLDAKLNKIWRLKSDLMDKLSDYGSWANMNKRLSRPSGFILFLLLSVGIAITATVIKANYDRGLVENNGVVDFGNWQETWPLNKKSICKVCLENFYEKWFFPTSRVEVRFRDEYSCPQTLLHIGSTSDFLIFWRGGIKDVGTTNAEMPLIVPKINILQMLSIPKRSNSKPSTECPALEADGPGVAGKLGIINSSLIDIKELLSSRRKLEKYPDICGSGEPEWFGEHIIFFEINSAVLDEEDKNTVREIAQSIEDEKHNSLFVVVVEGRADSTGRYLYNRDLAERRADAVQNQLQLNDVKATVIASQGELVLSTQELLGTDNERRSVRVGICRIK